jgi:hypothetical protein
MKDSIVEKLVAVLSKPIVTEAEVVYTLIEIRKLMDRCGVSRDDQTNLVFL